MGVFVNHENDFIHKAISEVPLDMIQLHGEETPEFCYQFKVPVLKTFRIKDKESLSTMNEYNVSGFLLDTFSNDQYGGTGKTIDWSLLNEKSEIPIILSWNADIFESGYIYMFIGFICVVGDVCVLKAV